MAQCEDNIWIPFPVELLCSDLKDSTISAAAAVDQLYETCCMNIWFGNEGKAREPNCRLVEELPFKVSTRLRVMSCL